VVVGCWVSSLENPSIRIAIDVTVEWQPGTAADCAALQICRSGCHRDDEQAGLALATSHADINDTLARS
jgi:hypothetical protein